jgi:hypothetical protein
VPASDPILAKARIRELQARRQQLKSDPPPPPVVKSKCTPAVVRQIIDLGETGEIPWRDCCRCRLHSWIAAGHLLEARHQPAQAPQMKKWLPVAGTSPIRREDKGWNNEHAMAGSAVAVCAGGVRACTNGGRRSQQAGARVFFENFGIADVAAQRFYRSMAWLIHHLKYGRTALGGARQEAGPHWVSCKLRGI